MPKKQDQYGEKETVERADAALKRMLSTPHQPHKPLRKSKKTKVEKKNEQQ